MIFPILYGHMTFASHRCWTVYVKKGIFQAAEAWRRLYGSSIRHAAIKAGGGEIIQHLRQGMDPYPLQGWRWVDVDGQQLLEGPLGQRCETTAEAFDHELAKQGAGGDKELRGQLTMIQKFLNQCCSESLELKDTSGAAPEGGDAGDAHVRQIATTSPLEDWLWRGSHPIVKEMHWYLYSMWVFRVEKMPLKLKDDGEPVVPGPRFIDIEFSPDYKLHRTHKQRIATEFRVPLYEGFTMPPSTRDSETAAMYKALLLRALSVEVGDDPEDVRLAAAFEPLCTVGAKALDGNEAFTHAWLVHADRQRIWATEAAKRFLDRYEYMSLWETQEVQDELNDMWEAARDSGSEKDGARGVQAGPDGMPQGPAGKEVPDPDEGKPRATVQQYAALIAQKVMANLEGLAQARLEKRPRPYQTDAEIHQAYIKATSGGAHGPGDEPEDGPAAGEAPQKSSEVFPLVRGAFDAEEMRAVLDFEHKRRLTPFLKELLSLPFMDKQPDPQQTTKRTEVRRAEGVLWRSKYQSLADAPLHEKLLLKKNQEEALEVNAEEDHIEKSQKPTHRCRHKQPARASFAAEGLYAKPSAYIQHLLLQLPADEKLT